MRTAGDTRVKDAGHRFSAALKVPFAPAKLRVAFVRGHQGPDFTGLAYDFPERGGIPDASRGIAR
ncbi:hypothetical protein D3C86_2220390 [compost metagenome]